MSAANISRSPFIYLIAQSNSPSAKFLGEKDWGKISDAHSFAEASDAHVFAEKSPLASNWFIAQIPLPTSVIKDLDEMTSFISDIAHTQLEGEEPEDEPVFGQNFQQDFTTTGDAEIDLLSGFIHSARSHITDMLQRTSTIPESDA